jgi:predicted kinase
MTRVCIIIAGASFCFRFHGSGLFNMVVIVFGLPGSGKSYFAERLAKKLKADYVNSDRLRKEMIPVRSYSVEEKAAVYKAMREKMKKAENENRNIVLDATFYRNETRKLFTQEVKEKDGVRFIEITAGENLTRLRLNKEREYSEADFEVYKLIRGQWEPLNEPHLVLESTDENIDSMLQRAAAYLEMKNDTRTNK